MGKGDRDVSARPPAGGPAPAGDRLMQWATLAGFVVLALVGWANYREVRILRQDLVGRLDQIDQKVASAAAPQQRRSGPDPNRVYPVKADTAPARGPAGAAVTIAEFSDFQ